VHKVRYLGPLLLSLVPLALTAVLFPSIPESIPAHWNFQGNVTRYGSRHELWIMPVFTILAGVVWYLMRIKAPNDDNDRAFFWSSIAMIGSFIAVQAWTVFRTLAHFGG